jgi:uncharacterized protein
MGPGEPAGAPAPQPTPVTEELAAQTFAVEVIFCPHPGQVDHAVVHIGPGTTLGQAVLASGVLARHGLNSAEWVAGVWGRRQDKDHPLRQHDRVELYRPLLVDPKEARRQRYGRHKEALLARQAAKAAAVAAAKAVEAKKLP